MDVQEIAARLREVDELYEQRMGVAPHARAKLTVHSSTKVIDAPYASAWMWGESVHDIISTASTDIADAIDALSAKIAAIPTPDEAKTARIAALKAELDELEGK